MKDSIEMRVNVFFFLLFKFCEGYMCNSCQIKSNLPSI